MKHYDSKPVEEVAAELRVLAAEVNSLYTGEGKRLVTDSGNCMEGRAGDALKTSIGGLFRDMYNIQNGISNLQKQMDYLAKTLHEMDEKAKEIVNNK